MRTVSPRAAYGALALVLVSAAARAEARAQSAGSPARAAPPPAAAIDELAALYRADQADRSPGPGAPRDFFVGLEARDAARQRRATELYRAGRVRTGPDFFHAAMILQHGPGSEAPLIAHELAMAALALGEPRARSLAAASLDRFLLRVGRPQRFGTQSRFEAGPQRFVLDSVDAGVTDVVRAALNVRPLEELRARVRESNRQLEARGVGPSPARRAP